ncbi:MAG: hypothetical protein R2797_13650 [Gelidibacter sp.]
MKRRFYLITYLLVVLTMVLSSCATDGELSQNEELSFSPTLKSDLIETSIDANRLIDKSSPIEKRILTDTIPLEFAYIELSIGKVRKASLKLTFKNSLEQNFTTDFEFLNDANELKFKVHVPVSAGTKEAPMRVETNVLIEEPETTSFMEATKVVYKTTPITTDKQRTPENKGTLELQSDVTYFFE